MTGFDGAGEKKAEAIGTWVLLNLAKVIFLFLSLLCFKTATKRYSKC